MPYAVHDIANTCGVRVVGNAHTRTGMCWSLPVKAQARRRGCKFPINQIVLQHLMLLLASSSLLRFTFATVPVPL